jgi:2-dehydro-3-deoxyphosphooctonate aldolase (KDO 8-P synthase)
MTVQTVPIGDHILVGPDHPLVVIAGPCVVEDPERTQRIARSARDIAAEAGLPFVFKASFDKANRTSLHSYRGPGMTEALEVLRRIRQDLQVPILVDVHTESQIEAAAEVADVLQIPAFLCRQTDFVMAVARAGRTINVKKGQFLSPWDLTPIAEKILSTGNQKLLFTERGASFGYQNLVVDMRSIPTMRATGFPAIFDATHSVQLPGAQGDSTGGQRTFIPYLARSAVAAGCDGVFLEVHDNPAEGLSDTATMFPLKDLPRLLEDLAALDRLSRERGFRGHVKSP